MSKTLNVTHKTARIVSVFDGMACGMIAMQNAGIDVERYVAYEIDKYAVQTTSHNFPMIEQRGDVFDADFAEFEGFDFLIGGSPCTYWSIAQKNNRETEASGMGWELFCQYVRALREVKPKFFIYENNKSMSSAIRESITNAFGFEPICINSALVSAQNRQRLYWVGKRNEDGTYSKVDIQQPEDRGILLRDVLDGGYNLTGGEKSFAYTTRCQGATPSDTLTRHRHTMAAEPVNTTEDGKARTIRATCYKDGIRNMVGNDVDRKTCVAEPVRVGAMPRPNGELSTSQGFRVYSTEGKSVTIKSLSGGAGGKTGLYAISVGNMYEKQGQNGQLFSIDGKSKTLSAGTGVAGRGIGSSNAPKVCIPCEGTAYAVPCEWDEEGRPTKAASGADGKTYQVYEIKGGQITIKGKQYPIKLADGFYIIRKLTVSECKRLQTVPEWYEFPVSDTQAYKMLGNGWTCDVITHLIEATQREV